MRENWGVEVGETREKWRNDADFRGEVTIS